MWAEIRKLVVLIAGIGFMVVGIVLIVSQIQATGVIDIGTEAFKGKIESGSAGLFVCFFAFWLIVIPILPGKALQLQNSSIQAVSSKPTGR